MALRLIWPFDSRIVAICQSGRNDEPLRARGATAP